jgi:hypothetical protein
MTHDEINDFIKDHYKVMSDPEIARELGLSLKQVEHRRRRLGLSKNGLYSVPIFLSKARTEKEVLYRLKSLAPLKKKYEGLNLFKQINEKGENVYILLPEPRKDFDIKKRDWSYHIGKDTDGTTQPYIVVQLNDFEKKMNIAPLFDVHYGNVAHRKDKFLSYLKWIKNTDNVYVILGGDLVENAIDDGRGMTYDQNVNPQSQLDEMVEMLVPIAHKILVATSGNHEWRTYKKTGIDFMKILCDRLSIPYFAGPVLMSVLANNHKWSFYIQHGFGNSQTKGGKLNMASKPKNFTSDIQFFVQGHVHDAIAEAETCLVEDSMNCRLKYMTQWIVICPSFLRWANTYAYRAGYKPPSKGGVALELDEDGDYRARLV